MLGDEGGTAPVHDDDERRPWEFDADEDDRRGCVGHRGRRARDQGARAQLEDPTRRQLVGRDAPAGRGASRGPTAR